MLVALPAGGRGGDKLDTGATATEAPAATGAEAGAAQARTQVVAGAGGEAVAAAPAEAQASASHGAATAVAAGNGGGDHGCREGGDRVRTEGGRGGRGVRACGLKPLGVRVGWPLGQPLPPSNLQAQVASSDRARPGCPGGSAALSGWFGLLPPLCYLMPHFSFQNLMETSRLQEAIPSLRSLRTPLLCGPGSGVSLPSWGGGHAHTLWVSSASAPRISKRGWSNLARPSDRRPTGWPTLLPFSPRPAFNFYNQPPPSTSSALTLGSSEGKLK